MTTARFRQIADDLRERIALGDFGGAGSLDSEAALGARYAASRMTIRKALELLRNDRLVESRQGSGWFATGSAVHQRLALGTFRHAASAIAESGRIQRRRVVTFSWVAAPSAVAGVLNLPGTGDVAAEVLHCRSVRTVDDDPLDLVTEWIPAAYGSTLSRADAAAPGIWQTLQAGGLQIVSVRQTITAGIAGDGDAELLSVEPGVPLLLIRRLALDAEHRPVALADHRYLAHRFSLEVEFNGFGAGSTDTPPGLRAATGG